MCAKAYNSNMSLSNSRPSLLHQTPLITFPSFPNYHPTIRSTDMQALPPQWLILPHQLYLPAWSCLPLLGLWRARYTQPYHQERSRSLSTNPLTSSVTMQSQMDVEGVNLSLSSHIIQISSSDLGHGLRRKAHCFTSRQKVLDYPIKLKDMFQDNWNR